MPWQRTLLFSFSSKFCWPLLCRNTINFCKLISGNLVKLVCLSEAPAATEVVSFSTLGTSFFSVFSTRFRIQSELDQKYCFPKDQLPPLLSPSILIPSFPFFSAYFRLDLLFSYEHSKMDPKPLTYVEAGLITPKDRHESLLSFFLRSLERWGSPSSWCRQLTSPLPVSEGWTPFL